MRIGSAHPWAGVWPVPDRRGGWGRGAVQVALAALPLLFLLLVLVYPLALVFVEAFTERVAGQAVFTLQRVMAVWSDPYYHRLLAFTAHQALLSSVASHLLGLPVANLLVRCTCTG